MVRPDINSFASRLWIQRCAELWLCAGFKCHDWEINFSLSALSFSGPALLSQNWFFLTEILWNGCTNTACCFLLLSWNKQWHDCSLGSKLSFTLNLVDISIHILYTVTYTYPMVLTKRICLTIKVFLIWWSFPLF